METIYHNFGTRRHKLQNKTHFETQRCICKYITGVHNESITAFLCVAGDKLKILSTFVPLFSA